jgi:putative ABC transport system ATP-binding protein
MVEIKNVHKKYMMGVTELWALKGVSLTINKGEFVALSGSSGSGKTTLLNLIGCLDVPSDGSIEIDGKNTSTMNQNALADLRGHSIGYIFQTFNLLPVLTAVENVEYPILKIIKDDKERRKRALDALERVGLLKHADHRPDQLSGGQRQRVAIARALIHQPKLIVADEPTANLDRKTSSDILDILKKLNEESGQTVIIASHDSLVHERCKRIIELRDGRLVI